MKAITRKFIEAETMLSIVESIIDSVCAVVKDPHWQECYCQEDDPCTCTARYESIDTNDKGFAYSPDHYGAWVGISFLEKDIMILDSTTCGGADQKVIFNLATNQIIYTHDGHRQSGGGLIWDHLPKEWQQINNAADWSTPQVETTEPGWGVDLPLLQGQFGESPCNLREHMSMQNELRMNELTTICRSAGMGIPADIIYDEHEDTWVHEDTWKPWTRAFTGVHYRHMTANGVRI